MERILNVAQNNIVECPHCHTRQDIDPHKIPFDTDENQDIKIDCIGCLKTINVKDENGWNLEVENSEL